jgi:C4-dicarboxylate-specific signal transduction histidine kinase
MKLRKKNLLYEKNNNREAVECMSAFNDKLVFSGKIAAAISHDINNPLFAISNSFQLARKYFPTDNPRVNQAAQIIEKSIKRLKDFSLSMPTFIISNIEEAEQTDLTDLINNAIDLCIRSDKFKNIQIDFKQHDSSFPLFGRPCSLQQVFINMIENAVTAMAGKGKITIDITTGEHDYRIDFSDTGPGIPEAVKPELFLPFKANRCGKGCGSSLYLSHNIIALHGGAITLDDSSREGAHFIIKIPKITTGGISDDKKQSDTTSR